MDPRLRGDDKGCGDDKGEVGMTQKGLAQLKTIASEEAS
jgi:hypothetical protein